MPVPLDKRDEEGMEHEVVGSGEPMLFIHGAHIADALQPLVAEPASSALPTTSNSLPGWAFSWAMSLPASVTVGHAGRSAYRGPGTGRCPSGPS